jgi:TRAP-type C4-dicarboxylate transport system substrate-binding protein
MKLQRTMAGIFVGLCLSLSLPVQAETEPITLKLATLAPEGSTWMKIFDKVNQDLQQTTGGAVKMRAYPGGVMGDDQAVLRKMRIGQIHIAGLTGLGLGSICNDIQVLGTPFLFQTYDEVDYVLARVTGRLERLLNKKGYVYLGWSEIGFIYMMSNKPVVSLETFRRAKVWMPEGDPVSQAVFQKAGVTPVPLGISDVLLALQTGLVDVVYSPPVGAITLQWFTKVKYVTRVPLSYALGGVMMTQAAFRRIPKDHQRTLKEIFRENLFALNFETRKDNEEALRVMEQEGIQFVDPSPQELRRFQQIAQEATEGMVGKVFTAEILQEVNTCLKEFRGEK